MPQEGTGMGENAQILLDILEGAQPPFFFFLQIRKVKFTEADASSKVAPEVSVRVGRRTLAYRWLSLRSFLS